MWIERQSDPGESRRLELVMVLVNVVFQDPYITERVAHDIGEREQLDAHLFARVQTLDTRDKDVVGFADQVMDMTQKELDREAFFVDRILDTELKYRPVCVGTDVDLAPQFIEERRPHLRVLVIQQRARNTDHRTLLIRGWVYSGSFAKHRFFSGSFSTLGSSL